MNASVSVCLIASHTTFAENPAELPPEIMYPRFENFPRMTESAVSIQPTRNAGARILVKLDTETTARKSPLASSGFFAKYFLSTLQNRSGKGSFDQLRMWYTSSAMMWNLYSCASLTNSSRAFCGIVTPCGFECVGTMYTNFGRNKTFRFFLGVAPTFSRIELIGLINVSPSSNRIFSAFTSKPNSLLFTVVISISWSSNIFVAKKYVAFSHTTISFGFANIDVAISMPCDTPEVKNRSSGCNTFFVVVVPALLCIFVSSFSFCSVFA
mmetsp:Transcript_3832/g.13608  ORF Transcript_3832/g.13608 Transcript_3832/m.13608 type:complete len:268 (+) Transcript_3832:449-1252(+)